MNPTNKELLKGLVLVATASSVIAFGLGSRYEICAYIRGISCEQLKEERKTAVTEDFFEKYDLNHDGKISPDEYKKAIPADW